MVRSTGSVIGAGTICAMRDGLRRDAASIACASFAFIAIRASHSTCLPASSAAIVICACMYGQVPMQTASTVLRTISVQSP